MVYGCILVAFGASAVAFSMAEMASMYEKTVICNWSLRHSYRLETQLSVRSIDGLPISQ